MRTGRHLADAVRPVIEPGIGRIGIVARLHPILRRIGERRAFDMRRQQHEIVDRSIIEGQLVDMQREGLVVLDVDAGDAAIKLGVADRALRVAADLVGEQHVFRRHRHAVAPLCLGADRVGDIDALLAIGQVDRDRKPIVDRRQFGAQEADQLPIGVVDRERPQRHSEHIAFRRHRIDVRIERRWELGDSDRQRIAFRACRRRRQQQSDSERRQPMARAPPRQRPACVENVNQWHRKCPKRLKTGGPGHIIRYRRGRIRNTESCVFAGTKQRCGCFRPEAHEGRPRVEQAVAAYRSPRNCHRGQ